MAQLCVIVPDAMKKSLKREAAKNVRSLSGEVIARLQASLENKS